MSYDSNTNQITRVYRFETAVDAEDGDQISQVQHDVALDEVITDVNEMALDLLNDISEFNALYLGAFATDPVLDNDGNPLVVGQLYVNSAVPELRFYSGAAWVPAAQSSIIIDNFVGDGVTTSFALNGLPINEKALFIYIDGLYQNKDGFALSGGNVFFSEAPPLLADIEILALSTSAIGVTTADLVTIDDGSTVQDFVDAAGNTFATVALLQADTSLSYTSGTGLIVVAADDYVRIQEGGYSYKVLASGGSGDITNSNGTPVQLKVVRESSGSVRLEQFGGRGDGVGSEADNDAAFAAFNTWAQAQTGIVHLRLRSGGDYANTTSRWSMNIPKLRVSGYGAIIRNTRVPGLYVDATTILTAAGLDKNMATPGQTYVLVDNYLVDTVAAGDTTFTASTAAEAGNFSVGEWVMVASREVFQGNPAAFRNFDYAEVTSVDAGTGIIGVDRPLTKEHLDDLPDSSAHRNAARVYKIEQSSLWNIDHSYEGLELISDNIPDVAAYPIMVGKRIKMIDCISQGLTPTVADDVEFTNCETLNQLEGDKNVRRFTINGGTIRGLTQCVSIDTLTINHAKVLSTSSQLVPNHLILNDVDMSGGNGVSLSTKRLETVMVKGGRLRNMFPLIGSGIALARGTTDPNMVIGTGGVTLTNNYTLNVPLTDNAATRDFLAHATPGAVIREVTNISGNYIGTGVWGTLRSIVNNAGTSADLSIDFNGTVGGTGRLAFSRVPAITMKDVLYNDLDSPISMTKEEGFGQVVIRNNVVFNVQDPMGSLFVEGIPSRVEIDVKRAMTIAGVADLAVTNPAFSFTHKVDLATVGKRLVTFDSFSGNLGLDTDFGANLSRTAPYASQVSLEWYSASSLSDYQYAVLDMRLEYDYTPGPY